MDDRGASSAVGLGGRPLAGTVPTDLRASRLDLGAVPYPTLQIRPQQVIGLNPEGLTIGDGVPDGDVTAFTTPDQIRQSVTGVSWLDLRPLADGSYRLS